MLTVWCLSPDGIQNDTEPSQQRKQHEQRQGSVKRPGVLPGLPAASTGLGEGPHQDKRLERSQRALNVIPRSSAFALEGATEGF